MILPSKLLQDNLNEQSQSKIHSVASFMQQQDENVVKWHETTDVTKTDQLSSNDENTTIINLSVKQRAQMFETALSHANESINVRKFVNKLDNCSEESFIQRKKRRAGTPIPNYRKTFAKISLS